MPATAPTTTTTSTSAPPPTTEYDYDLAALRDRKSWAVRKWIYGERDFIRRVLIHYGVPIHDLDDTVQEVFHQAIRSLPDFRGASKVRTWLYSISRNVAYRDARDRDRHKVMEPQDVLDEDPSSSQRDLAPSVPDPHTEAIRSENRALIEKAMRQLPSHYQEVIRLRDLDEQSTSEAAEALGLSKVNTRVRLHRARKKLKEILTPYLRPAA